MKTTSFSLPMELEVWSFREFYIDNSAKIVHIKGLFFIYGDVAQMVRAYGSYP